MKLTIPALQPGTAYKIQVRTDDGEAVSDWSPEFTFTTDIDSRSPGVPANRTWVVSGDSFVGRWDAVTQYTNGETAYITAYEVELNSGATTKIISVPNKTDGTQIEYVLSYEQNRALFTTPQATVNFRVRAVDNKGLRGAWSAQIPASNPAPATPTNSVVVEVVDGIDLSWTAPSDADLIGYNVYVGTTAGFTPSGANRVFSGNATQFHYASTTYSLQYFKIRAVDKFNQESGDLTAQGTPQSPFTVDTTAPATPTALAATIANNSNGIGAVATVTWTMTSPPTDLAGFNIRWRKTGSTDWSVTTTDSDSRAAIVELGSAYQDYDFQIRSFDFSANESAWSATALGDSPANSAPAQVTGVTITPGKDNLTIAWNANTEGDLDDYEVQVATNNTFTTGLLTYRVGATTLAVNGLAVATTYYVRVRAKDTGGLYGTYSATANATTGDYPGSNPSDGEVPATPGAATLVAGIGYIYASWNPVTLNAVGGPQNDTVTYEVHTSTSLGGTYTKVFETSGTFAVLENLSYASTYYVKLIAKDRDGASALGAASNGTSPAQAGSADIVSVNADVITAGSGIINNLIINTGGAIESANYVANTSGFRIDDTGIDIGADGYINAGALKAGTVTGTTIVVGAGGVLNVDSTAVVKSNNYVAGSTGWQLDSAGLEINDGSVKAGALVSDTIDAATLTLSGANGKIVGTGFELSGTGLTVTNGTIEAAAVKIQAGENLLPTWFTDFEATAQFFQTRVTNVSGNFLWDVNGAPKFGAYSFGFVWNAVTANPVLYFGSSVTDYNIPVEEGEEYIFSAYLWCRGAVATNAQLKVKWSTGAITTLINQNLPASMPDTNQPRYSAVATAPAGATGAVLFVESSTWTANAGFNVDGMQVERKSGSLNTPSQWRPGGLTAINGGLIRTGEIRSTANSQTWDGTQYIEDANRPAWSIDPEGDASFNRMNVRGRLVVGDLTAAAAEGGDPYGYLYTAASANYVQGSQGWLIRGDGYAEFRDLAADSIHGEAIRAGTLTADKIATGLLDAQVAIVGDVYAEGNSGERVGINKDGFYVYGPKPDVTLPDMGPLYVSFPTDGTKPNIITGELQANTLLATGGISVRGSSEFSAGSEIKMFNNVSESKSAPSLSVDWETTQLYGTEWDTEMSSTVNMWWRSDITPNLTGDAYFDEGTHGWESNTLFETHAPAAIQYNATENYVELQFPTAAKPSNFGTWVKTVPGQSYTITASVWVYTGNQAVKLAVAYGATGAANTVFDGWTNITLNFTATGNEHYIMVQTDGNATGGNAFVDHVLLPQHQAGAWEVAFRTPIDEVTEEMHFRIFTKNGRWAGRPPSGEGWNSVNYANGYYVSAARWIDSTGQQYKARIYRYNPTGAYTIVSWKDTATGSLYSVSYTKIAGQSDIEEPRLGVVGRSVADGGTGQELVVWERNVASKRYQGSVRNTNLTHKRYIYLPDDTTAVSHGVVGGVVHHPGDFGSDRFIVLSEYSDGTDLYAYTGSGGSGTTNFTGTRSRNEDFPRPLTTTTAVAWKPDAAAPGGTGYYYTVNNRGKLYKHEGGGNKWTTETNKWWVGFTWYDNVADKTLTVNMTSGSATITATTGTFSANDVGRGIISNSTALPAGATIATYVNSTTVTASVAATGSVTGTTLYVGNHETKISARAYIMMTKRARLNITVPSFPPDNGTTDTVNKARIYMARSSAATAPSLASDYNYNTEIATVSGTVSNATFASARKPPVNGNFPGGNPATIISSTGNSFWKANDEAQFQNLVLVGTDDASTAAGNKPALRIGTTTGSHLRIDGDEIIKMDSDSAQGTLYLNDGGTTISSRMIITSTTDVNASAGNTPPLRIGNIAGSHLRIDGNEIMSMANDTTQGNIGLNGCFFSKFDYGTTTQSTGTTGYINVAHNMGKKADYAQAVQASFYGQNWSFKWDNGGSTSTYNRFLVLEGSSAGSSSPVSVDSTNMTFAWFCIAA